MSSDIDQRHQHTKELFSRPDCQLSYLNGVINRMEKEDIRIQLRLLGLDDRGVKKVLKKRLKNYYKKQKLPKPKQPNKSVLQHDYYIVIDFEGTCEEKNSDNYVHEIIEFPAILINGNTLELEDEFHQYCRPTKKTILSEFCQNLTGITQETVDAAQPFSTVLNNFMEWLEKHKLDGITHTFAIITDGPWDLGKFLPGQCTLSGISIPGFASKWVNLRKHYRRYYHIDRDSPMTLEGLLEKLGMPFEGRPHSGIDDARNIAKMFVKMVNDGLEPRINDDYAKHERLRSA